MMDNGDAVLAMAASITDRAHDLISDGWVKGMFYKKVDGAPVEFCILGALELAMQEMFPEHRTQVRDVAHVAEAFILQEVAHQYKGGNSIPGFNDAAERQLDQVLSVLRVAAQRMWDISVQSEDVGGTVDLRSYAYLEVDEEMGKQYMSARLVAA